VVCRDHPEVVEHVVESGYMIDSGGSAPGNVGAALAHITLWEHIVQRLNPNDIVLVMEDNVLFMPSSLTGTCDAIAAVDDFDYLALAVLRPLGTPVTPDLGIRQVNKEHLTDWLWMPNLWMSSYLVTGNGAAKLLNCLKREPQNYGAELRIIDRVVSQQCLSGDASIRAFIVDHSRFFGHTETHSDSRVKENTASGCSYVPPAWRRE
jgi:GR25 family glycosyltransferase involved in LPS biosynthesis